ncbi:glycosyl transferase [Bombiscardovia apis]|uniref:Glycosyl transferase n=1 Tax=Bombiscardovia apis TaxID=2932182 RepID=A0ABN6SHA9_9BIFI|nr:glycosyltransferase family A protein [Bombiscardovia apis]BDR55043.1 glycosyl transferase [Bombiscardovia apis]
MLTVSVVIPAWNEEDRIADCILNATTQSVAPLEVLVVDNHSTDRTAQIVQDFIAAHPDTPVQLLHQDEEQGLIPTRNYGLDRARGDILGRIDADCMLRPNWVEVVSRLFENDSDAMGATGPVAYYDMPGKEIGLKSDNKVRRSVYRADDGQYLLFGSNMALRASAWKTIRGEVCRDEADIFHEDVDVSLHLIDHDFKMVYCKDMNAAISARRMDTSFNSFHHYMQRFKNTFDAHPSHTREQKPEHTLYAIYPILRTFYPVYQKYLESADINPAERIWIKEQMELFHRRDQEMEPIPANSKN